MKIKLWGVRGSCPVPMGNEEYTYKLKEVAQHVFTSLKTKPKQSLKKILECIPLSHSGIIGGNTTCVEVRYQEEQLIIDLGTGARELGEDIVRRNAKKGEESKELHILMTHTHWDHIQGWPFFAPAYGAKYKIHFYSSIKNLERRMKRQQNLENFPLKLEGMLSEKIFHYIEPNSSLNIGSFSINTRQLIHPGRCTSYDIRTNTKHFIFATDTEFFYLDLAKQVKKYHDYFQNADLVVMDAQYSIIDAVNRKGWGHTAMITSIDCALHWGIKHLVLTHHEPSYRDKNIWEIFGRSQSYLKKMQKDRDMILDIAQEGAVYELRG